MSSVRSCNCSASLDCEGRGDRSVVHHDDVTNGDCVCSCAGDSHCRGPGQVRAGEGHRNGLAASGRAGSDRCQRRCDSGSTRELDCTHVNRVVRLPQVAEEVIQRRLDIYEKESRPVLSHYSKELITVVDAIQPPVKVLLDILKSVNDGAYEPTAV